MTQPVNKPQQELFAEHGSRLQRYLRSRLANEADAQDLTQEAYLRLLRVGDPKLIRDPVAYLYRIARNLVHELHVGLPPKSTDSVDVAELIDSGLEVEGLVECQQQIERLDRVMDKLSPKCRAVLVMHRRDGMTYGEIAEIMEISTAMVKKYLATGLSHCRKRLRRFHEQ